MYPFNPENWKAGVSVAAALLLTGVLFLGAFAMAGSDDDLEPSVTVRYDDLDLSASAGVRTLKQRIYQAATQVCESREGPRELYRAAEQRRCVQDASRKALMQIELPPRSGELN